MKKILFLAVVIILALGLVSCANIYKNGVDYNGFPKRDIPIYDDGVVFSYEGDNYEHELIYGTEDSIDDIVEFYQAEFEDAEYMIVKEKIEDDEYYIEGVVDDIRFEIEAEKAKHEEKDYFDTIVEIKVEKVDENADNLESYDEDETTPSDDIESEAIPVVEYLPMEMSFASHLDEWKIILDSSYEKYEKATIIFEGTKIPSQCLSYMGLKMSFNSEKIPRNELFSLQIDLYDENEKLVESLSVSDIYVADSKSDLTTIGELNVKSLLITGFDGATGDLSDISGLLSMEYFSISNTHNITGDLSDFEYLTGLKRLLMYYRPQASGNLKGDLASLKNLTKLQTLKLEMDEAAGQISGDINQLAGMTDLEVISLLNVQKVTGDVDVFVDMKSLSSVSLSACQNIGGDITAFSNLINLTELTLIHTDISGDIKALASCPVLKDANFKGSSNVSGKTNSLDIEFSSKEIEGTKIIQVDETEDVSNEMLDLLTVWISGDIEIEFKPHTGVNSLGDLQGEFISKTYGNGTYSLSDTNIFFIELNDSDDSLILTYSTDTKQLSGLIGNDYLFFEPK